MAKDQIQTLFGKHRFFDVTDRELLIAIYLQQERMMSDLDNVTAAITTAVNQLGIDLTKAITDLQAKIAAGADPTEASNVTALQAVATALQGFDAQAIAADATTAPPVAPAVKPAT